MTNYVSFHNQLASIMEVLVNTAITKICELVDDSYTVLHMEIARSQGENKVLRDKLQKTDLRSAQGDKDVTPDNSIRKHFIMPTGHASNELSVSKPDFPEESQHPCRETRFGEDFGFNKNGESSILEEEDHLMQSVMIYEHAEDHREHGLIPIKKEKPEEYLDPAHESWSTKESISEAKESGADEDKRQTIVDTQMITAVSKNKPSKQQKVADKLYEGYGVDVILQGDRERVITNQRLPYTTEAERPAKKIDFGTRVTANERQFFHESFQVDSQDPVCSYTSDNDSTYVSIQTELQRVTSPVDLQDVKPVAVTSDSEPNEHESNSKRKPTLKLPDMQCMHLENVEKAKHGNITKRLFHSQVTGRQSMSGLTHRNSSPTRISVQRRIGMREKRFICGFCGKSFTCPKYLQSHQRVHTGEKPFSCKQCGKRFGQAGYLKKHLNVHTGEKPFACPLCGKRFADSSNLIRHKSVHTGERLFICIQCGERFAAKHNLRIHLQKSHSSCQNLDSDFSPGISVNSNNQW